MKFKKRREISGEKKLIFMYETQLISEQIKWTKLGKKEEKKKWGTFCLLLWFVRIKKTCVDESWGKKQLNQQNTLRK